MIRFWITNITRIIITTLGPDTGLWPRARGVFRTGTRSHWETSARERHSGIMIIIILYLEILIVAGDCEKQMYLYRRGGGREKTRSDAPRQPRPMNAKWEPICIDPARPPSTHNYCGGRPCGTIDTNKPKYTKRTINYYNYYHNIIIKSENNYLHFR